VKNLYYATASFSACFSVEVSLWVISGFYLDDLYNDATGILAAYYAVNVRSTPFYPRNVVRFLVHRVHVMLVSSSGYHW
jgi:hypothetical protein